MDRRRFLSRAGFGTLSALAGFSATPAMAKKPPKLKGVYLGEITRGEETTSLFVEITDQKKRKVEGEVVAFGSFVDVAGKISSSGNTLVLDAEVNGSQIEFRGAIKKGGKKIQGIWTERRDGQIVATGKFTLERSESGD